MPGGCWELRAFGKPQAYRYGSRILDENSLPGAYCMDYGNGFMVWVSQGKVQELRLEMQTSPEIADFAYQGRLKLGSSLEDVFAVMGTPDRVQEGGALAFEDGVLYKNLQEGFSTYGRGKPGGIRVWLQNDRVGAMSVRPEPRVP